MKNLVKVFALFATLSLATTQAQAAILVYAAILNGASEAPPNASAGTGLATVTIDTTLTTMRVQATFSGLTGNTTAAHIHGPTLLPGAGTAGVITTTPSFVGFPLGVTSGSMDQTFDMTLAGSYNAAFITANGGTTGGAFTALQNSLNARTAYFNVHTSAFPGGEIRGFLATTAPEPTALVLMGLGGVAALTLRRRRA